MWLQIRERFSIYIAEGSVPQQALKFLEVVLVGVLFGRSQQILWELCKPCACIHKIILHIYAGKLDSLQVP